MDLINFVLTKLINIVFMLTTIYEIKRRKKNDKHYKVFGNYYVISQIDETIMLMDF